MLRGLFPVLATEYAGLTEAQTGVIYLVSSSAALVAGPGFGWLSDNVSRKLVLSVRSAANALSSVVYIAAPTFLGIGVGRVVDDMGKAAFRPAWGAMMAHVSSFNPERRARTMSLMSMGEDGGRIAGPVMAGLLWSTGGIAALLGARVIIAGLTEVYAWRRTGLGLGAGPAGESADPIPPGVNPQVVTRRVATSSKTGLSDHQSSE
jgi:MFS family permease